MAGKLACPQSTEQRLCCTLFFLFCFSSVYSDEIELKRAKLAEALTGFLPADAEWIDDRANTQSTHRTHTCVLFLAH